MLVKMLWLCCRMVYYWRQEKVELCISITQKTTAGCMNSLQKLSGMYPIYPVFGLNNIYFKTIEKQYNRGSFWARPLARA
jgi:hypothetical protein